VGGKLSNALSSSTKDYPGPGQGNVQVQVVQGESLAAVGRDLKSKDVVASVDAFLQAANANQNSSKLQPGFYGLRKKMSASEALTILLDPAGRIQSKVALPEGLRMDETLKRLASSSKISLADFEKELKNAKDLGLPAYAKSNPEGFLFPATYEVTPNDTASDVLKQLFQSYARAAEKTGVERTNRSPYELVIIASLVEAEARHAEDFGKVARVVYNRLDAKKPLEFDSTVNYLRTEKKARLTVDDTKQELAYNTYQIQGLPPTPIDSPGDAALQAALNPDDGDWIYFVTTSKDGSSLFTSDYQAFLAAKAKAQADGVY
jgi:UPF0755 protein